MNSYKLVIPIPVYNLMSFLPSQPNFKSSFTVCKNQFQEHPHSENQILLNLTAHDLQQAGYHNDRTPWTELEDSKLISLSKNQDLTWKQIAKFIDNRTPKMCYSRYRRLTSQTKQSWTTSEDELIKKHVCDQGQKWESIAQKLKGRTAKQVEQHYFYCLRPEINRGEWNVQEDLKLIQLMKEHGKNWKILENSMNGRTQQQIKNRYFGRLKKLHERKMVKPEIKTMESL